MSDAKTKRTLLALKWHEEYGHPVKGQLRKFWETGEPWKLEGRTFKARPPGWEENIYALCLVSLLWTALCESNLDDAVVGKRGEWKQAGTWLPLFQPGEEGAYIVAELAPPHAVGWFHEETHGMNKSGYRNGAYVLYDSLDAFLKSLEPAPAGRPDDDGDDDSAGGDDGDRDDAGAGDRDDGDDDDDGVGEHEGWLAFEDAEEGDDD